MTLDIDDFCGSDKMNALSPLESNTKEKFSSNSFSFGSADSREGSASPPTVNGSASPSGSNGHTKDSKAVAEDHASPVPCESATSTNENSPKDDPSIVEVGQEDVSEAAMETDPTTGDLQVEAKPPAVDTRDTSCEDEKVISEEPSDDKNQVTEDAKEEVMDEDSTCENRDTKQDEIQTDTKKPEEKVDLKCSEDLKEPLSKEDNPEQSGTSTSAKASQPSSTDPSPAEDEEKNRDTTSDNKMATTEDQKDASSERSPNPSSKNFKFVDESVQDEEPVSIINEISFEPVNSNDTDEDEDEDDPPGLETVTIPPASKKDEEKDAASTETLEKEVRPPATVESKKLEDVEVTTIDDDDDDDSDPVRNYDQALRDLNRIDERARKVLDSEDSRKRPAGKLSEPATKKAKPSLPPLVNGSVEVKNKQLKKMSRKNLEQYFAQRMVQMMLEHKSEVGALRRSVDKFKEDRDFWKTRAECQTKQLKDLSTVMTKYLIDSKTKPQTNGPMRITRSVGLQVGSATTAAERRSQSNRAGAQRLARPNQVRPTNQVMTSRPVATAQPVQRPSATTSPRQSLPPIPVTNMARQQMANGQQAHIQQKPLNKPAPEIVEVDLSDDDTPAVAPVPKARPVQQFRTGLQPKSRVYPIQVQRVAVRHPAPLPNAPVQSYNPALKNVPPKPSLTINKGKEGVVLSWNMTLNLLDHATISSYQLYAYQEVAGSKPDKSLWKKVGDVKALPLPMACTLKQFSNGNRYHFAVRACDTNQRQGEFSAPASISI